MSESNFIKADVAMQELLRQQNMTNKEVITNRDNSFPNYPTYVAVNNQRNLAYANVNQPAPITKNIQTNSPLTQTFPSVEKNFVAQSPFVSTGSQNNPATVISTRLGEPIQPERLQTGAYSKTIQTGQSRLVDMPKKISQQKIFTQQQIPPEELKVTSKIEYIPFNRKVIQYEEQQVKVKVPKTRKVVQYRQQLVQELIPREVKKKDYYAIEYLRQYVAQYVPEVKINMVEKAFPYKRIEYAPVTRELYHGAPFGNEGVQNLPFSPGITGQIGAITGAAGSWQNNIKMPQIYGTNLYQGGWSSAINSSEQQYKSKFSNLYDNYEHYIPSFKY